MFQQPLELSFLQDVFRFSLNPNNEENLPVMKNTYLEHKSKRISLARDDYIIDSALFEYLSQCPNPLVYMQECRSRIEDKKDKPWYQIPEVQQMTPICTNLLQNYSQIALLTPDDLFQSRVKSEREASSPQEIHKVIVRLFDVFEALGWDSEFFQWALEIIQKQQQFASIQVTEIILDIVYTWIRQLHIYSDKVFFYLNVIQYYLNSEALRTVFFTQKAHPWLPQPSNGEVLELKSALGPLLSISLLAKNDYIIQKAYSEFSGRMTRQSYYQKEKAYQSRNKQYVDELVIIIKSCLKKSANIDGFPETLKFFKACILGNANKIKEGFHLNKQNRKMQAVSSDGFMLNIYDVLLELSRKIFNREDDTYKKIDPNFWKNLDFADTPLLSKIKISEQINVGNVSNLFFYTLKFAQFALVPAITSYKEVRNDHEELKKQMDAFEAQGNQPQVQQMIAKVKDQLLYLEKVASQYESVLFNSQRINDTLRLYDTTMILIDEWLQIPEFSDGECGFTPSYLNYYLPEFLLINIYEVHSFYLTNKEDYPNVYLNEQRASLLLRICTILINLPIATNKYIGAQFIELIFLCLRIDRKQNHIKKAVQNDLFVKKNFAIGLIKYYVTVGDDLQYYAKFSYRQYINEILTELAKIPYYHEQIAMYERHPIFERMIKAVLGDLNCGIEEIWTNKLSQIEKFKKDIETANMLDKLKLKREQQFQEQQCRSNLISSQSYMHVLSILAGIVPNLLKDDLFRDTIAQQLNYYLALIFDKDKQESLRIVQEIGGKDFKLQKFIQGIAGVYISLASEAFVKSVAQDQRSFKLEYLQRLLNKVRNLSNQHIDDFINFISQLQSFSQEDFDIASLVDVPEEFQDCLNYELMVDPVMLPQSKNVLDRKTIKTALLEKQQDPFTKTALTEAQLIEMPELKLKIKQWLAAQQHLIDAKKNELFKEKAKSKLIIQQQNQIEEEDEEDVYQGKQLDDDY